MNTAFLSPSDGQWADVLETVRHDVYHRPAYARASAEHEGGTPVAFYAEDASGLLLAPLLLRAIPETERIDATSPYGYPAPLWTAADPTPHWAAFLHAAQARGLVSVFVRLHPFLPIPAPSCFPDGRAAVVKHGPTVWIDCARSPETMWANTRSGHQSDLRRLQREGYYVEVSGEAAPVDALLPEFVALYRETMDRVGASPFYDFSDAYFRAWAHSLRPYCRIAVVRSERGAAAAAGLFTEVDGWMQYHLSGTAAAHRPLAPAKLMLHAVRVRAHHGPCTRLHLGGGVGADTDSLFDFKAGFSPTRASFSSLRIVCDPDAYRALRPEAPPPGEGFFPAYRSQT